MKKSLYGRLALHGMLKNRKLCIPYLLSCAGTIMMFYILEYLSRSEFLRSMPGGDSMLLVLSLGKIVIAFFSFLFLMYTNSFLARRRFREFGLYSVLGMGRSGNLKIVFFESLFTAFASLILGLFFGIVFSKLAELAFLYTVHGNVNLDFSLPAEAVIWTVMVFLAIFTLLALKSSFRILRSNPLTLLRSENQGEKPPRANLPATILGLVLLLGAYVLAIRIKSPLSALILFFVAVLMVIAGTYLLFISGSVAMCRFLQKKKNYYYRKEHFISVSSMAFRMKRNGAGLASICILSTMVLVMCSSSASLYFGTEDTMKARYPMNSEFKVSVTSLDTMAEEKASSVRETCEKILNSHRVSAADTLEYQYAVVTGLISGDVCDPTAYTDDLFNMEQVRSLFFVSADDYNRSLGTDIQVNDHEAILYTVRCDYTQDSLRIGDIQLTITDSLRIGDIQLTITGRVDRFISISQVNTIVLPSMMLVISDYKILEPLASLVDPLYGSSLLEMNYYYGYNTDLPEEESAAIFQEQTETLRSLTRDDGAFINFSSGCIFLERSDFYGTFGGLFYIGIVLSVIFIFAVAVMIYYKQICEGYEDQARFAILQKVGMNRDDIRKSINSQILTVFCAPLIMAGIHQLFAFPLVWKLLQLFGFTNLGLAIGVTVGAYLLFAVFYSIIYKLTARGYYEIVTEF